MDAVRLTQPAASSLRAAVSIGRKQAERLQLRPRVKDGSKAKARLFVVLAQNRDGAVNGGPEDSSTRNSTDIGILNGGDTFVNGQKLSGGDMLKLFQDAQENMLFLNKQRLIAIEELQKVERDREFLMAKVAQVEAEHNASIAMRETLEQKLRAAEAALEMAQNRGVSVSSGGTAKSKKATGKVDPPAVWSNLLVRIDSMVLSGTVTVEEAKALRKLVAGRDIRAAEAFEELQGESDEQLAGPLLSLAQGSDRSLHVVQIVSELAPVTSEGPLGAWVLGLCRALRRKGHTVEVVMPLYYTADVTYIDSLREHPGELYSFFEDAWHCNKIWTGSVYGIPVTFIQPLHPGSFFDRDRLYGHEDDFERFTYFSRAALEYTMKLGKAPDVLHTHDWQTAIVAPLFWEIYHHQGMRDTRLLFTWHDVHYQNPQPAAKLAKIGLDPFQLNRPDRLQDPRDASRVNLLKGGVVYSNKVTTVSPRYAEDVKTPELGCGLDNVFRTHGHKVEGIPSGLDETQWDPLRDPVLPLPLSPDDDFPTAKAVARSELRSRLGLPLLDEETGQERPLVACVVPHIREGELDLLRALLRTALEAQAQFVFVGASKSPKAQAALEELQRDTEDPNARLVIYYEPDVAHLAVAAAQMLACITSRDPEYSLPMAGMKYGALPVCRQPSAGHFRLVDVDDPARGHSEGVGFFANWETPDELSATLFRAINDARANPEAWAEWTRRAMSLDTTWDSVASSTYVDNYWSIYRC